MTGAATTPPGEDAAIARPATLQLLYQETCRQHTAITDFRAKLLALLPLASGIGALVLLTGNANTRYFGPIGLYGIAITTGLFLYELRGIQTCITLRRQAAALETALGVPAGQGQFRDRPRAALGGFVGAEGASWVVYLAILTGWAYVAGLGFGWWHWIPAVYLVLLYLAVLAVKWLLPWWRGGGADAARAAWDRTWRGESGGGPAPPAE
jgi:hypothetical protein